MSVRRDELIGRTIASRFRVNRVLGEGGMAMVFVAEQDAEPREVALKILRPELSRDRTFAKRFEREAKAAARVQHPNSVTILDAGVDGGLSYIAMELLRGDDLYALLERHGALSPRAAATIVAEVCDALAVAHGLGIVHRDLKPENIMVVSDPGAPGALFSAGAPLPEGARVKVLDFGIAKLLDRQGDAPQGRGDRLDPPSAVTAVTRVGTLIGTPAYMSPEQCSLLPVDARSDIYTCGVLLFQMIAGRLPFEGPTPLHIATKHIHQDPPALRSIVPDADPALDALILKALAKKPTERQPTARHLGASLRRLLPSLATVAHDRPPDLPFASTSATPVFSGSPLSIDVSLRGLEIPDPMASAQTVVASTTEGSPASVVVHDTMEEPGNGAPRSLVESEPEELVATLVRGTAEGDEDTVDDMETTRETGPPGLLLRQETMQSAPPPPMPPAPDRSGRISVMDAAEAAAIARVSAPPVAPAPVVQMPAPTPPPTFGFPAAPAAPVGGAPVGRALWLGVLIGVVASAILFSLMYALVLSR